MAVPPRGENLQLSEFEFLHIEYGPFFPISRRHWPERQMSPLNGSEKDRSKIADSGKIARM